MKNVITRAISGAVYVALIVGAILGGPIWFTILLCLFALLGTWEISKLSYDFNVLSVTVDSIFAVTLTCIPILATIGIPVVQLIAILALFIIFRVIVALYDRSSNPFDLIAKSFLGVIYLGIPLCCLALLYLSGDEARWMVLALFAAIWINDTGAFCFGCTLGKHRLCERLSPKKSWEGFWGGLACCIGWCVGCNYIFPSVGMNVWQWAAFGLVISLFATWGDLFESLMKRNSGVKDSGNLIPGHGGILDRIDSLLLVAPAVFIYFLFV